MSIGFTYPSSRHSTYSPEEEKEDDFQWDVPSPTDSESSTVDSTSPKHPSTRYTSSTHSPPSSPPNKLRTATLPSKPSAHPYNATIPNRQTRPRNMGLTPLSNNSALPLGTGALPKAQPLSRALFARMANDTPHAGMVGKKKVAGGQKIIVPTKGFKRTFELDLSASELARK